jgi:FKBP12-rapamycin complex-associated protein
LKLSVPGTYRPNAAVVSITHFSNTVEVIASKQRPRRMSMRGSDGKTYVFLLKGKEDLRQDERVMQLFGLINICLDNDRSTSNKSLNITRYSVLPLSNNSGVIGWVHHCDTINSLIRQYRLDKGFQNEFIERTLIRIKAGISKNEKTLAQYHRMPLMQKLDVFTQVLESTTGEDLSKVLWLKSKTADVWVERRASFTKSVAVMSMVGYILGLGDRHLANLMLHRVSGRVVHIDFGDCFEVTKNRKELPEIIPFRLTRMLTKCMGSSGIEGTYKATAYRVSSLSPPPSPSLCCVL